MQRSVKLTFAAAVLVAVWFAWSSASPVQAQLFSYGRYAGGDYIYNPYGGYTYVPYSTNSYGTGLNYGPYLPGYYGSRFQYAPPIHYSPYGNPYRGYVYTPFGDRF